MVKHPVPNVLQTGEDLVVLSWGALPKDLDLHLVEEGGCHVYYGSKTCSGEFKASLDVDETKGGDKGPETITTKKYNPNKRYMVFTHAYAGAPYHVKGARVFIKAKGYEEKLLEGNCNNNYWLIGCFNGNEGISKMKYVNKCVKGIWPSNGHWKLPFSLC